MYAAAAFFHIRSLPDLVQPVLLTLLPGPAFGFLIDQLQHSGKVLEEVGVLGAAAVLLTTIGWATTPFSPRLLPIALVSGLAWLGTTVAAAALTTSPPVPIITTAAAWCLVWSAWAATLLLGTTVRAPSTVADVSRRRFINQGAAGAVVLACGGYVLWHRLPDWISALLAPPEAAAAAEIPTPTAAFYLVSKNFQDPILDSARWHLEVSGLVERPLGLNYPALLALPAEEEFITLECISNRVGGRLLSTGLFSGPSLRELLSRAQPAPGAKIVSFVSADGYREQLALDGVGGSSRVLLATHLNGSPLPPEHGYPLRLVVPGRYGMKSPKWLTGIEVGDGTGRLGFWEARGWDPDAEVKTTARIVTPGDGDHLARGVTRVAGIAYAGERGIRGVELSSDGGTTWTPAMVDQPLSRFTAVGWHLDWRAAAAGAHVLVARAQDGQGRLQVAEPTNSFPSGAGGYHSISVRVGAGQT